MNKNDPSFKLFWKIVDSSKLLVLLVIASMTILLGITFFDGYESNKKVDYLISISQMRELTIELESKVLQMRRAEKDFLARKDITIAEKYIDTTNNALDVIEKIKVNPNYPTISKSSINLQKQLQMLYQQFGRVLEISKKIGLNEKAGLNKVMRENAHLIEKALIDNKQINLQNILLNMRRDEKDFIVRQDKRYIDALVAKEKMFFTYLKATNLSDVVKNDLGTKINAYVKSFKELSSAHLELAQNVSKLSSIYAVLNTVMEEVAGFIETLRDNGVDSIRNFMMIMHMASTSITIILLLAVALLSLNMYRLIIKIRKLS